MSKLAGVYQFIGETGEILYIGKAKNLQNRLKSYFAKEIGRGPVIDLMVSQAVDIKIIETESEIEAVILEADLIGKLKPKYNIRQKDDKSFLMIKITKPKHASRITYHVSGMKENQCNEYSKVSLIRYKDVDVDDKSAWYFGPYPAGDLLKRSMCYLRRVFPYYDCSEVKYSRAQKNNRACLYGDLHICSAPCVGAVSTEEYTKNITYLKNFLRGKKKQVIKDLEQEMATLSQNRKFEAAAVIRDRLTALRHIGQAAIGLRDDFTAPAKLAFRRIEAYDIANISGQYAVGAMIVFSGGETSKKDYRRFRLRPSALSLEQGQGDVQMMKEVLARRFANDWPRPDLILVDGGVAHLNLAMRVLGEYNFDIPVVAIAKGPKRDKNEFHFSDQNIAHYVKRNRELEIILVKARNEAHRFAQSYYKKLHSRGMMGE